MKVLDGKMRKVFDRKRGVREMETCYDASVIIPTYNRELELGLTLDALTKQKTEYTFEVLVADDGSHDHTKEVAAKYRDQLNLRYFYQEDQGYRCTAARNMGIRNARGKICIFIDCGVLLSSQAVQKHLEVHRRESGENCLVLGYTYANYPLKPEEAGQIRQLAEKLDVDALIHKMPEIGQKDSREEMYQMYGDELSKWPAPWAVVYGCNLSAPIEFVKKIGMFDENFNSWGADDNEFGIRVFLAGGRTILERQACSIYYPHNSGNKQNSNPNEFVKRLRVKQEYIYNKFHLAAVRTWMNEPFFLLNQVLIERGEDGRKVDLYDQ